MATRTRKDPPRRGREMEPAETLEPPAEEELLADGRTPILWHSNAPWAGSGYGTQSGLFGPLADEMGYRVAFSAFFGLEGARLLWTARNGRRYPVYPRAGNAYGSDVIGAHYRHWSRGQAGMVFTLTDPWVLSAPIMKRLPTVAWTPVDHEPLMLKTHQWLAETGAVPLAMSRFGEAIMQRNGFKPLYCPHGYDAEVFKPIDRDAAREALNIPRDAFLVLMVAANRGDRKCYPEALAGFSRAAKRAGRQMLIYLHTALEIADGVDLPALCEAMGIVPLSTDPYSYRLGEPPETVSLLMNAADVLLNPAQGEGFGVPLAEAQACGTPCVVTDFSASPEVAPASAGNWNVEGVQATWTGFKSWQVTPSIEAIEGALVEAFEEPAKDRLARRRRVAKHAEQYESRRVADEHLRPALEDAFRRISFERSRMGRT